MIGFKFHILPARRTELFEIFPHDIREALMSKPLLECNYGYLKREVRTRPSTEIGTVDVLTTSGANSPRISHRAFVHF